MATGKTGENPMIYQDEFGVQYKIRETLNSKLSGTGTPVYKIHKSFSHGKSWMLETNIPGFRNRWWRYAASGEHYLKDYATRHNWKLVKE